MKIKEGGVMDIQNDKDFAALPEVAKLYQACKERDLTIAEREYLKGARDAWQAKSQAVPEGFVLMPKIPDVNIVKKICTEFILGEDLNGNPVGLEPCDAEDVLEIIVKALEPAND